MGRNYEWVLCPDRDGVEIRVFDTTVGTMRVLYVDQKSLLKHCTMGELGRFLQDILNTPPVVGGWDANGSPVP